MVFFLWGSEPGVGKWEGLNIRGGQGESPRNVQDWGYKLTRIYFVSVSVVDQLIMNCG